MDRGHYIATINAAEHVRTTRAHFTARTGLIGSSLLALALVLLGSGCAVKQDAN